MSQLIYEQSRVPTLILFTRHHDGNSSLLHKTKKEKKKKNKNIQKEEIKLFLMQIVLLSIQKIPRVFKKKGEKTS